MSSFENVLEVAYAEMKEVIIMGDLNCNLQEEKSAKRLVR